MAGMVVGDDSDKAKTDTRVVSIDVFVRSDLLINERHDSITASEGAYLLTCGDRHDADEKKRCEMGELLPQTKF